MPNFFSDNDDIRFYLEKGVDWKPLIDIIEDDYTSEDGPGDWEEALDNYRDIIDLMGGFAAEEVDTRAAAMDQKGTRMVDGVVQMNEEHEQIFAMLKEMGVYGLCIPRELGGQACPGLLYLFISEMVARGDVSTMTHFGFHVAMLITLVGYSIKEGTTEFDAKGRIVKTRWQKEINEILSGETWGSMDLTEPNAGSDLAALRCKAVKDDEGVWRVTGNKIFITSGHGKYHFVLAKTANEDSLKALSLFLVPLELERDNAVAGEETIKNAWVDRIEEKIGHHGSATCSVQYEDSAADLIGNVGDGFKLIVQLMNHARLGVTFESIGLCEAAYRCAKDYAAERVSMGVTIDQHPMIADMLDEMEVTIKGLRALAVDAAMAEETTTLLELKEAQKNNPNLHDAETRRQIKKRQWRSRFLTPLLKYFAAESAVRFARLAMQIHAGNGYTKDYAPERLLRDALVLPVYEGTSQIQALMALKDNLGQITKNPQRFLKKVAATKLNAVKAIDPMERTFYKLQSMAYSAQQYIMWRVARGKASLALDGPLGEAFNTFVRNWDPKRDFAHGLLHAENLTQVLVDVAIAEVLIAQAQEHPERRDLAERWLERVEPRVRYHCDLIHSSGDRLLAKLDQQARQEAQEIA